MTTKEIHKLSESFTKIRNQINNAFLLGLKILDKNKVYTEEDFETLGWCDFINWEGYSYCCDKLYYDTNKGWVFQCDGLEITSDYLEINTYNKMELLNEIYDGYNVI